MEIVKVLWSLISTENIRVKLLAINMVVLCKTCTLKKYLFIQIILAFLSLKVGTFICSLLQPRIPRILNLISRGATPMKEAIPCPCCSCCSQCLLRTKNVFWVSDFPWRLRLLLICWFHHLDRDTTSSFVIMALTSSWHGRRPASNLTTPRRLLKVATPLTLQLRVTTRRVGARTATKAGTQKIVGRWSRTSALKGCESINLSNIEKHSHLLDEEIFFLFFVHLHCINCYSWLLPLSSKQLSWLLFFKLLLFVMDCRQGCTLGVTQR